MGRAESARRERPSRRLSFRPRSLAGLAAPASSLAGRLPRRLRLAPAAGLLWACLALALAGTFASPAQAQGTDPIWSTTMTVGETSNAARGFNASWSNGTMGDAELTYNSTDTRVGVLVKESGADPFEFGVIHGEANFGQSHADGLVLEVAGEELLFSGADNRTSTTVRWTDTWLLANAPSLSSSQYQTTLAVGNKMAVCLRTAAQTCPDLSAPTLDNPIPDQTATPSTAFSYTFPADTFSDANSDTLTYTATLADGITALPAWLSLDGTTRTFSGTPADTDVGRISVKVTATDPGGLTASDTFDIVVSADTTPLWSTTMTVGEITDGGRGYNSGGTKGALADSALTYNSVHAAVSSLSKAVGTGTFYFAALHNGLDFDGSHADGLVLEVAGERLPFSGSSGRGNTDVAWTDTWLLANAPSLSSSQFATTLAIGAMVPVCLRTATQICPVGTTITPTPTNNAPTVENEIPDQAVQAGTAFSYQFPADTFDDADTADTLTYTAAQDDDTTLPTWLSFNASTRTFSGTPADTDVGTVSVKVTANDGSGETNATVSDTFDIAVKSVCTIDSLGDDRVEVWSGTLTVGTSFLFGSTVGFFGFNENLGDLSDNTVNLGGDDHTIIGITLGGDNLIYSTPTNLAFVLESELPAGDRAALRLHVCNTTFDASAASHSVSLGHINSYTWSNTTLDWATAGSVGLALSRPVTNTAPTVENEIPDQTAQAGTAFSFTFDDDTFDDADAGDTLTYTAVEDGDSTLPTWLTFTPGTRTFSGTPADTHVGTISVKVTADDGSGVTNATVSDTFDIEVIAAPEACSVREAAGANWCTTMTVGESAGGSGTAYGFAHNDYGGLVEGTIDHGRTWEVRGVWIWDANSGTDGVIVDFQTGRVPHDTAFDFGGESFTANAASEHSDNTRYRWDLPAGLAWIVGQKVTVSANLPPEVTGATVDGASLVLTYVENLDTSSVPGVGAYSVSVDSGAAANPSNVGIAADKVTLTLASAVSSGQAVTVSYTVPATNPVQDVSGIAAAGFGSTDHTVTNNTGATNNAPTVENEIPDQAAQAGTAFSYQFPADTFDDADAGDTLEYTAAQDDDSNLPTWLSFNATTRTFTGTPAATDVGTVSVKVTASDGTDSVSDTFDIVVIAGPEACSVREAAGANWCTTLTVGTDANSALYGWKGPNAYGSMDADDRDIEYGGRTWSITHIQHTDTVMSVKLNAFIHPGTVFNLGGSLFTADGTNGTYAWNLPSGFAWFVGQKVTASANLPPTLVSATVDGASLVLTYAENLDTNSVPALAQFTVKKTPSGGSEEDVDLSGSPTISGTKVTLTLDEAVVATDDAVKVSYAVPASSPLQDLSGLDASAETDYPVTNNTGATNTAPTVANAIPDQSAQAGTAFSFTFDDDTFDDTDTGDALTYTAAQDDDTTLPTWLSFDAGTRTFSGTPADTDVGTVSVKVTADDGSGATNATVSDTFDIEVIAAPEACSVREAAGANWCTTMTVEADNQGVAVYYGFEEGDKGTLANKTLPHGGTTYVVDRLRLNESTSVLQAELVVISFETGRVPRGTTFNFGGTTFAADADSESTNDDTYQWSRPADLAWFDGQKVTVSANLPPVLTGATVDATSLVLTYHENLDTGSVPALAQFTVKKTPSGGTEATVSLSGSPTISGAKVTLTLTAAVVASDTVKVSYAVPTSSPLQDLSGLDASAETDYPVTNNTGVSDDATLSALVLTAGTASVDLTPAFASNTENYTATVANGVSQITVAPTFSDSGASADYLDAGDVDIPDDDTVATGQQVALEVGENTIKVKVTAEDGTTMKTYTVTVTRSDTTAPAVSSAKVDGDELVITFDEPLAAASKLASGAFTVKVTPSGSGTEATVTLSGAPSIDGARVTLTLASAVAPGDTVTVGYTVPGTDDDNRLEDGSGKEVATFANWPVTNRTTEADKGDTQLTDGNGNAYDPADGDAEGRLEVFFRGRWGSVCDDRFDRDFDDPGTPESTKVPNQAAHLACRWAGFETGAMVSNAGKAAQTLKIWLDDVRCVSETDKHWRPAGSPGPTGLHHCYNAGVGLHNCKPEEDVWLACTGTLQSATQEEEAAALTAAFEDVPGSHDGATPFTFRIVLSEAIANDADDVRDNVVKVTGGSVGSATSVNGQTDEWRITVDPDGAGDITLTVEAGGACGDPGVLCTAGGEGLSATVTATVEGEDAGPFTAAFEDGPGTHDGASAFNVFLRFSEAPANVKNFNIKAALQISGGTILRVRVVGGAANGDEAHRRVEIEPSGDADVRLSLFPTTDCTAENALCTSDGRKLESLIGFSVPGPASAPPPPAPITATFENVPKEHQGKTRLDLHVRFSEPPTGGRNAVAASLTMTRAAKWGVKPLDDTNKLYRSALRPHDFRPIAVTLNPTADCAAAGALCTAAGGKLETGISVTIPGPVAISVADATVEEAAGAVLAFAVTLDRTRHDTVTVDYATENGTATAGEDYTAASGTLTFAAGETAKTVEVAVLDDLHDEGNETLVLRLSNPSGARIADGEATGTIENTDLMPQAWLARFGRTVAEQVIDAVESRMRAPRTPGAEVSLAGRRIGLGPLFGADAALAKRARETGAEAEEGQRRLAAWLRGAAEEEERPGLETRTVTQRALLLGSSFSLTAAPGDGAPGAVSLWGRAAVSRFDGREDGLTLDGEVASGLLGADWARERSTLGLILSHSRGEGGYRGEAGAGTVSSTLTGLYPWGRHALSERVTVWGVAGYGAGTLTLTPEDDDGAPRAAIRTDMDLMMGAAGLRGTVVQAPAGGGPELAVKTDALAVRTSSEAVRGSKDDARNLAAAQGDVTRLRLGLEGTWRGLAIGTGTLEPRLEAGVRHDGGDAETGFGLDLGGGLAWSDPGTGIRAEVSGRGLLTHESAGFSQRGIAGSFGWDPAPGTDRGPSLSLTQTMGLSARGGADALLGRTTLEGLAANDEGNELDRRRLELRLGYGFGAFGDRFTSTPELGFGMSEGRRDYSLGWRFARDPRPGGIGSLELSFEARRQESANDNAEPEHSLGIRLTARF